MKSFMTSRRLGSGVFLERLKSTTALLGVFAVTLLFTLAVSPRAADAATGDASVYVVHGIPGDSLGLDPDLPVDVLVDDALCALEDFRFGDIAGPLSLAPKTYNIKISLADISDPCSNDAVIEANVPLGSDEDAAIVAHLDESGAPTASKFSYDLSGTDRARVIAHHVAEAPLVDITLNDPHSGESKNLWNVSNGTSGVLTVHPQTWLLSLYDSMTNERVFGYTEVDLMGDTTYLVYAVGSLEDGNFDLLTKAVSTPGTGMPDDGDKKKDRHHDKKRYDKDYDYDYDRHQGHHDSYWDCPWY